MAGAAVRGRILFGRYAWLPPPVHGTSTEISPLTSAPDAVMLDEGGADLGVSSVAAVRGRTWVGGCVLGLLLATGCGGSSDHAGATRTPPPSGTSTSAEGRSPG